LLSTPVVGVAGQQRVGKAAVEQLYALVEAGVLHGAASQLEHGL
jgi:hypothetical protein